jgi:hypothetical protein
MSVPSPSTSSTIPRFAALSVSASPPPVPTTRILGERLGARRCAITDQLAARASPRRREQGRRPRRELLSRGHARGLARGWKQRGSTISTQSDLPPISWPRIARRPRMSRPGSSVSPASALPNIGLPPIAPATVEPLPSAMNSPPSAGAGGNRDVAGTGYRRGETGRGKGDVRGSEEEEGRLAERAFRRRCRSIAPLAIPVRHPAQG